MNNIVPCDIFQWDTAGQESFRSLSKKYFQKADAVVVMFEITNNV